MRIVTIHTTRLGSSMTELAGHDLGEFFMAAHAQIVDDCIDRAGILRILVFMADTAVAAFKRGVRGYRLLLGRDWRQVVPFQLRSGRALALFRIGGPNRPAATQHRAYKNK